VIEPIRDHWVIAMGVIILITAGITWWRSRR
jgi:hypothetical protein